MDYAEYLNGIFPNTKVQKISVNAGFTCPNRDGTIGVGGCSYCRNDSFSPIYCRTGQSVKDQIEQGKRFFSRKYKNMKYLAYFQSYTNTYGREASHLERIYAEALECEDIVGLVIGTRPDTVSDEVMRLLSEINSSVPVFLEIGAESSSDDTLSLINRNHTWEDVVVTVGKAAMNKIHCGLHLIAGLPGEDNKQVIRNVKEACALPIETLKLHQLQILKETLLYRQWKDGIVNVRPYTLDEYLDLCVEICRVVPERIVIERFLSQSPPDMVVEPKWGLKNYQFVNLLKNKLRNELSPGSHLL